MKKVSLVFASLFAVMASAQASTVSLNYVDTNDCARSQKLFSMLNKADAQVTATCSDYLQGGYSSDNGRAYDYRLYTTVTTDAPIVANQTIQLNFINANECEGIQKQVSLLNSSQVKVTAECSPYVFQGYRANNGKLYNYRLYTSITVLY